MKRRNFIKNSLFMLLGLSFIGNVGYKGFNFWGQKEINSNHEIGRRLLSMLTINVADHCNLSCKYCDTFSPVAEPVYLDPDKLDKDLKALRAIVGGDIVVKIGLLGGEPLLNSKINEILRVSRRHFPEPELCVVTNGTLLNQMSNEFWNTCRENNINISVSAYPINVDFNEMKELASKNGVKLTFRKVNYNDDIYDWKTRKKLIGNKKFDVPEDSTEFSFPWSKITLDLFGKQDIKKRFQQCLEQPRIYTMFLNGKIYHCFMTSQINHFNKFFKKNLSLCNEDYIDIHKAKSLEEVLTFLETPKPFCKYCTSNLQGHTKWDYSELDISEWT